MQQHTPLITAIEPRYFLSVAPEHQRLIWRSLTRDGKIALVKALIRKRP